MGKTKEVRESINHKICVNRANEIVTFKRGYGFGEPIQYIRRGQDESLTEDINALNEYMFSVGKQALDSELAEWLYVCGLGMRNFYFLGGFLFLSSPLLWLYNNKCGVLHSADTTKTFLSIFILFFPLG